MTISPLTHCLKTGNIEAIAYGKYLLSKGKVGAVVLAGGQGTRLGLDGPKGTFPISPIKKKSLFQILCEKTFACGKQVRHDLQIAFMTSDENHEQTVSFFKEYAFFGLKETQVHFFQQTNLPLTDEEGNPIMKEDGSTLQAADGNGSFFWQFTKSGLYNNWQTLGIEYVTCMVVDNPLIDPFDAEVIGITALHKNSATIQAVEKRDPDENVGLIVEKDKKLAVIEYSEMDASHKNARNANEELMYRVANISFFCFSMIFIQRVAAQKISLFPLHKAKKKSPQLGKYVIKSEYFIFDMLRVSKKTEVILYPRWQRFAPLKNKEGEDSIETVQKAYLAYDKALFEARSHSPLSGDTPLELPMEAHYPILET